MKEAIDGSLVCEGLLLRDHFCGNELKRQGHGREQDENGVDDRSVTEARRSEIASNRNVVGEIDSGVEPGTGKQDDAAGNDARLQRLSGLDNRTYHCEWVSMRCLKELHLSQAFSICSGDSLYSSDAIIAAMAAQAG